MKLLFSLAMLMALGVQAQIVGVGHRKVFSGAPPATINLGTVSKDSTQTGNKDYYQTDYIKTGANAAGYSVTSCSVWLGASISGAKVDCVLIPAGSATTYTANVLCHGTYIETSTAPNAFVSIPMSGCGTLAANTYYWVGFNTNDVGTAEGYYSCDAGTASCTGAAGSTTYQGYYESETYGTYTGLNLSTLNPVGNLQVSAYITVTAN